MSYKKFFLLSLSIAFVFNTAPPANAANPNNECTPASILVNNKSDKDKGAPVIVLAAGEPYRYCRIFTMYSDGTVIYDPGMLKGSIDHPRSSPYLICKIGQKEQDALVNSFSTLKSGRYEYNASMDFFYYLDDKKNNVRKALYLEKTDGLSKNAPVTNDLSDSIDALITFENRESKPWQAKRVLAELRPTEIMPGTKVLDWPKEWAAPKKEGNNNLLSVNLSVAEFQKGSAAPDNDFYFRLGKSHYQVMFQFLLPDVSSIVNAKPSLAANLAPDTSTPSLKTMDKAVREQPLNDTVLMNRAQIKFGKDDYDGAMSDLSQAIKINPVNAELYRIRARYLNNHRNFVDAIKDSNQAILLLEKQTACPRQVSDLAEAYFVRGSCRALNGDKQGAISDCDSAIKVKPIFANAFTLRAQLKHEQRDQAGALSDYSEAIQLNPMDSVAYLHRGSAKASANDLEGAIEDYDKAILLNQKYERAFYERAIAKGKMKQFDAAEEDCRRLISLNPKQHAAFLYLGKALSSKRDYKAAIIAYSEAIRLSPNNPQALFERAIAHGYEHDFESAIEDCNRVIKLDDKYPGVMRLKAKAIEGLDRLESLSKP